jgi:hypothetical protein
MKCPHCLISFHEVYTQTEIKHGAKSTKYVVQTTSCPSCSKHILSLQEIDVHYSVGTNPIQVTKQILSDRLIVPVGSARAQVAPEVPNASDYVEACNVLSISAKASAALSRRVLQAVLHANNYKGQNLNLEIDLILNEVDPKKALPQSLRETIDGIRNFGNFSAHPITDKTSLQIIDVEPEEAEWCLEVVEERFDHFYVRPAIALKRKNELNAKLATAGKPPAK